MEQIQGKIALVTGGGSGINLAFAKLLCSAGCKVLIADISLHKDAKEWLDSLNEKSSSASFHKVDVTSWEQIEAAFDVCEGKFGTAPDIVVPGAGVYEPSSNSFWKDADEASRYKVLDINLVHPIKTSRIAIRRMMKTGKGGCIVHVSSIAGQRSSLVTPLYQASKHGINSFVRGMAPLQEMAGIRVVGVAPGTVKTPLFTEHKEASRFLSLGEDFLLPPEEVADAMLALITDTTKYKAGTILEVCDIERRWREVELLNDPGPQGPASFTRRKVEAHKDVVNILRNDSKLS